MKRWLIVSALAAASCAMTGAAAKDAKRGGTLVMGQSVATSTFNNAVASGTGVMVPGAQIFASPLMHDDKWNPEPYLAERWEVAKDNLSVTLHLRKDAVFHDGKPITSEDVAFSIITIRDNHPFNTMLKPVDTVDTPDPHTAVIRLKHPHPAILYAMGPPLMPILPKHVYGDGRPIKTHPSNTKDVVGSGPFKLAEFKPGDQLVLERFDKFFIKGRPLLDRIIIKTYPDSQTSLLELEAGRLHMQPFFNRVLEIERAKSNPQLAITSGGYQAIGGINWLLFNNKKKPFDDIRVRQAITHAIDREFIAKALHKGLSKVATGPIHSSFPQYSPDVTRYKFDLKKAEALLDAAGLTKGADGVRLKITCDYYPGDEDGQKRIAEYMKPALKKIGIEVEVRAPADFASWAKRMAQKDFDISMDAAFAWGDPVIGVHRTYLSTNIRPLVFTNNAQYVNPRVDELLAAAEREPDADKRKVLYAEFQKVVTADVPLSWVTELPYHTIYSRRVRNVPVTIWGTASPMLDVALAD
ncbi:MAG: ABC transporter substrate-binding protein [Hyphomicrobiaceae bacterium]|nr:MAG: ABC transporter substrate-binding protein [Hyphomicrobiaceae bacterium]